MSDIETDLIDAGVSGCVLVCYAVSETTGTSQMETDDADKSKVSILTTKHSAIMTTRTGLLKTSVITTGH